MTGCHVMAKPASSRCNLKCRYCFYIEKPPLATIDDATLEVFIHQHIDAQPGDEVQFAWQGGEPTLCGLAFFGRVSRSGKPTQHKVLAAIDKLRQHRVEFNLLCWWWSMR